jgi:nucleotide-binding universal stress UspA family protein
MIFIGSHGRSGLSRLLLGSVTSKVLALTHTAVLVYRVKEDPK